jgi:predicted transcriptional regulator
VEHPQKKAQEYDDQQLSTEDLEAIKQGQADIEQGRCLTLEEYRRGKRL